MPTTYERLVAAGAPAIREPYFYRITETNEGNLRIQVRKQLPRFGSTQVGPSGFVQIHDARGRVNPGPVLPRLVAEARAIVAASQNAIAIRDEADDLLGDAKPNS
jgi:hypothetical protein